MKRILFAILAIAVISICYAQLQRMLPPSVEQFYGERAMIERLTKANNVEALSVVQPTMASPRMVGGVEMIDAFISLDGESVIGSLKAKGVIVNCTFDGFITAQIPVSKLAEVSQMNGVTDVEISPIVYLSSDSTLKYTHAAEVIDGINHGLPQDYDGSGVVVGIIDNGFDYQHIAFRRADDPSKTRIVRVYDPEDSIGHPAIVGTTILPGKVRMGDEIYSLTSDRLGAHGTHVASIAAGTHVSGYGGMAPGADIVLCSSRTLNNSGILLTEVANCMKYIFAYADSVHKPCVVSLSYSSADGAHDGKDYLSAAVAQSVGPGHIFVISAGNVGQRNYYAGGSATAEKPYRIFFETMQTAPSEPGINTDYSYYYDFFNVDSWVRSYSAPAVKFHIFDRIERRIVWESNPIITKDSILVNSFSNYYEPDTLRDSKGYLFALIATSMRSMKYEIKSQVYNLKSKEYTINPDGSKVSRYHIGMSIYPRTVANFYVDTWMCRENCWLGRYNSLVNVDSITENGDTVPAQVSGFYAYASNAATMCSYSVHDSVISAGSYCARNTYFSLNRGYTVTDLYNTIGKYAYFSSYQAEGYGPTGKALPTVMAPGTNVVAAVNRYSDYNSDENNNLVMRTDNGYPYGVMSGTSMAAPTVAGIIAQWLQINPNLSPSDIKGIIAQTAIKDEWTEDPVYHAHYGPNGKIDAMAGVKFLLGIGDFVIGDVNGDGSVSPADLTALIDYLLDGFGSINVPGADLDQDGQIAPHDLSLLIDLLLEN